MVITGWGGQVDYLGPDHPWLVDYVLEPIALAGQVPDFGGLPEAQWTKADRAHTARLMRAIYDDREQAAAWARVRADGIRARHSPLTICSGLAELMDLQVEACLAPENGTSYD